MNRTERFDFVFPTNSLGYSLGALAISMIGVIREWPHWESMWVAGMFGFGIVSLPWSFYLLRRRFQVIESKARYERRVLQNQDMVPSRRPQ
jgi:hypothetical protein